MPDAELRPAICAERPPPRRFSSARGLWSRCRGGLGFLYLDRLQCEISRPLGKAQRAAEAILARPFRLALGETFGEHLEQLFDPVVIGGETQPLLMKIFRGHVCPLPRPAATHSRPW